MARLDETISETLVDKSLLNRRCIPTTAWWRGLVTSDGMEAAFVAPYAVKLTDKQFAVWYPQDRSKEVIETHEPQNNGWQFEFPGGCQRKVTGNDLVSVTLSYRSKADDALVATVPLVRTSVFVTVLYHRPTDLVLSSEHRILRMDSHSAGVFVAELSNLTKWIICLDTDPGLQIQDAHTLVSTVPVNGAVRIAYLANGGQANEVDALVQARYAIPVGGAISVAASRVVGAFTISWKTIGRSKDREEAPLLAAFAHNHPMREDYRQSRQPLLIANWVDGIGPFKTNQGVMYAVRDRMWSFAESFESLQGLPSGHLQTKHKIQILGTIGTYAIMDPDLLNVSQYTGRGPRKSSWLRRILS
ncbi:hypothetical protein EV175_002886 [Coemansia sp. RSA 1933]|nr:hypothetical protein EV175_002886 [Coemansia sp. RSA 1933]